MRTNCAFPGKLWIFIASAMCALLLCSSSAFAYEFAVKGTVLYQFDTSQDCFPLENVIVEIWDEDDVYDDLLATTHTVTGGYYNFMINDNDANGPDIYLKIKLEDHDGNVVRILSSSGGGDGAIVTYQSGVVDNYTGPEDLQIDVTIDCTTYINDDAHLYQVIYDMVTGMDFGTKTMYKVYGFTSGASTQFDPVLHSNIGEVQIATSL